MRHRLFLPFLIAGTSTLLVTSASFLPAAAHTPLPQACNNIAVCITKSVKQSRDCKYVDTSKKSCEQVWRESCQRKCDNAKARFRRCLE